MIQPHHTAIFLKTVILAVCVWSLLSILFGAEKSSISDTVQAWGREYPFVPALWLAVSVGLFFHWFKY